MSELHVVNHPLLQHNLSIIRNKETSNRDFRGAISEMAMILCCEATRDLPIKEVTVETPITSTSANQLGCNITVVPILRAGLGMVDGFLKLIPTAKVGHIGLYRNEETLEPVYYYRKMPKDIAEGCAFIVDPMLATGGSASAAIELVKGYGCKNIKLVSIISAPEGVALLKKEHPDVDIYTSSLDEKLNERGYIVPGLGDAGDRIFGTDD